MGLFDTGIQVGSGYQELADKLAGGLEKHTGYVSPQRQLRRAVSQTDLSDSDSVQKTFQMLMQKSPQDAVQWLNSIKPIIEAQIKGQPDTRKQQLINKENRNIAAASVAQGFGPRDTMEQKQQLANRLSEAGLGDTSMARLVTDEINAFKAEHFRQQKEKRIAEDTRKKQLEAEKAARWKPVFEPGQAKSVIFNMINEGELEAGGLTTDDKKSLADAMGAVVNIYDNKLATQRGLVSPQLAANYYTKALKLPEVYKPQSTTEILDPSTWDAASYSHEAFTQTLDKVFGQGNAMVPFSDLKRYYDAGLIIPGVTAINTPAGRKVFSSEKQLKAFIKKNYDN